LGDQKLRKVYDRAKSDYYFFCREILAYQKMTPVPHQEVCDHIDRKNGRRKTLTLMPRNSFKSSVITVGHSLFSLVRDANERILIASETQKNATKYVKEIKGHIEGNHKFRALFGDWVNQHDTWRDFEFTINKRTRVYKECSITASSLEKGLQTGMHYSKIYLDDVVSRANVNTPEQIQKTLDYYRLLLSILDPTGSIYINGTRWSIHDLYGWILDKENGETDKFNILVKQATNEDGELLMPDVLSKEFLEDQRATQGPTIFQMQYQNVALSEDNATFKPDWVKTYSENPKGLIYFLTIDPAISNKTEADFSGFVMNGVDYKHHWYIQEAFKKKVNLLEIIEIIFELADRYQPLMCLGLEKFALEKALQVSLNQEMIRRNKFIPIKEIETDTRVSKDVRIRALQPRFASSQIFLKKDQQDLYAQIVMHPQLKHDDLIDALKSQLAITFPSSEIGDYKEPNYEHLTLRETKEWKYVQSLGKRKVRVTSYEY